MSLLHIDYLQRSGATSLTTPTQFNSQCILSMETPVPALASQASSHFPLEPLSASVLADKEAKRRDAATALGACRTGCSDLDDYVLLGGFERGSVVGLSAEDEEMSVKVRFSRVSSEKQSLLMVSSSWACRRSRTRSASRGAWCEGWSSRPSPPARSSAG